MCASAGLQTVQRQQMRRKSEQVSLPSPQIKTVETEAFSSHARQIFFFLPDGVKRPLLEVMFRRRQASGLGQLQDLQTLLATLRHLLKPTAVIRLVLPSSFSQRILIGTQYTQRH